MLALLATLLLASTPTGATEQALSTTTSAPPAPASVLVRDLITPDGLEWRTVRAIHVAAKEAGRKGVKLDACRVRASENGEGVVVLFTNPTPDVPTLGCPPGPCRRCFEVLMEPSTLRVVRSNYSR